jgi:SseB protein N-terminal domain
MADHANIADSAGQPWAGRHFEPNASAGDDGSAPPILLEALTRFRAGEAGEAEVVEAFRSSRLLVPLLTVLGEAGVDERGRTIDKSQELSIVTVEGPDGRSVLPVFSSVAAMTTWNPVARPVPVTGPRVAAAAAGEGTDLVVLDPTSDTEFALRRPALWAIVKGEEWAPSFRSEEVARAFAVTVIEEPAVLELGLMPGDPEAKLRGPELVVTLTLAPGLSTTQLNELLARLSSRWETSELIAQKVDSLEVSLATG